MLRDLFISFFLFIDLFIYLFILAFFIFFLYLKTSNCVTELSRFAMLPALLVTSFFAAIFTAGYWK